MFPASGSTSAIRSHELTEDSFEEGFGFDASSIRGWASIHESDMLLIPDPNSAFMDPFRAEPTLVMIGDATDPLSHKPYHRDPRHVAKRAEAYLTSTGIADKAFFGAEAEFFIFDSVRFDQAPQHGFYFIDSDEGSWNSGREGDGAMVPTWATARDTRKAISPFRQATTSRICARKWC